MYNQYQNDPKNPANAAMPYLNQIPGIAHQYYDPYIQQGQSAYGYLNPQYQQMINDPSAILNKFMASYQPSKAYQLARDEQLKAAGNTAAAGGTRGTTNDIENAARITDRLMGDDMQRWLQQNLGLYGAGLQGEQGFYNTGFQGAQGLSSDLMNALGTQAQLAFQGSREEMQQEADREARRNSLLGSLLGFGGGLLGGKFGESLGGAIGKGLSHIF